MSLGENGGIGDWSGFILLFVIVAMFGWGGGLGNGGGGGVNNGYVLTSDFAMVDRKLDSITNGLCSGFYESAMQNNNTNMQMMQGFNQIGTQIADANYSGAMRHCETLHALSDGKAEIIGYMKDKETRDLRDENLFLKFDRTQRDQNDYFRAQLDYVLSRIMPTPVPSFEVPAPWQYGNGGCNGCGYGNR